MKEEKETTEGSSAEKDYKNDYLYLVAEFQNFQKRTEKEKELLVKFSLEHFFKEFIEVVDNFERMFSSLNQTENKEVKNMFLGLEMIHKQFLILLEKYGLKPLNPVHESFNPHEHEATGQEENKEIEEGKILKVEQKGYKLHERLLRSAKVIVNQKGEENHE